MAKDHIKSDGSADAAQKSDLVGQGKRQAMGVKVTGQSYKVGSTDSKVASKSGLSSLSKSK